jgi:acetoin utilization protein AcuB
MLVQQLINNNYPQLQLDDTVARALLLMTEYRVQHLPIVNDGKYLGIISEDILLDEADDYVLLKAIELLPNTISVNKDAFVLNILPLMQQYNLTVVPIVDNDKNYIGLVDETAIISWMNNFYNTKQPGAIIVLEMNPYRFSFSELSRLTETNNATIKQLNTQINEVNGMMQVYLKLNTNEVSDVVATLQRFDYEVVQYFGEEKFDNEIQENLNHLMSYLNV